jgi:hypothetical protein
LLAVLLVGAIFFFLSLLISFTFWLILKSSKLGNLLKGKLPLRTLAVFIFLSQIVIGLILAQSLSWGLHYRQVLSEQQSVEKMWSSQKDFYTVNAIEDLTHPSRTKNFFAFLDDQATHHGALLVGNAMTLPFYKAGYSLEGDVLYVTPSYLQAQNVPVSAPFKEQMSRLQAGQYGMVLPQRLQNQKPEFRAMFNKALGSLARRPMVVSQVSYVPNGAERFIYNAGLGSFYQTQTAKDPILIIVTPQSTTPSASMFWANNIKNFYTLGFEQTTKSIAQNQLTPAFNYVTNLKQTFQTNNAKVMSEARAVIASSAIASLISVFFFTAINLMYFTQFRREIYIKRVSGVPFVINHRSFILSQLGLLVFITIAENYLIQQVLVSLAVSLFIAFIAFTTLAFYASKQNKQSSTFLKGE